MLLTDAAFEQTSGVGGLGGVLVSPAGRVTSWFKVHLDKSFCASLLTGGRTNCIGELETLAVVTAFRAWAELLRERRVVSYVDNEGVRVAMRKGFAEGVLLRELANFQARLVDGLAALVCYCYARVPTHANIADFPAMCHIVCFKIICLCQQRHGSRS